MEKLKRKKHSVRYPFDTRQKSTGYNHDDEEGVHGYNVMYTKEIDTCSYVTESEIDSWIFPLILL